MERSEIRGRSHDCFPGFRFAPSGLHRFALPANHDQDGGEKLYSDAAVERQRITPGRIAQQADNAGAERISDL